MFGLQEDQQRARRIGERLIERRQQQGLTITQVARETGVSSGTVKRFEDFASNDAPAKPFRYEPWGAEYLERWLEGTLTPDIITRHDIQRILERDPGLTSKQVQKILPEIYEIYERALTRK